jgi:hypothetical protein
MTIPAPMDAVMTKHGIANPEEVAETFLEILVAMSAAEAMSSKPKNYFSPSGEEARMTAERLEFFAAVAGKTARNEEKAKRFQSFAAVLHELIDACKEAARQKGGSTP